MSPPTKKARVVRWLRRAALLVLVGGVLAAAAFWRWPLHIQAHFYLLGEMLTERPTPDEWGAAEFDQSAQSPYSRPQTQDYFPERTFALAVDGTSFMEISLAEEMQSRRESSLYLRRTNASTHIYRFTWGRSFDPVIVVRLEVEPDGTARLISKHFGLRPVGKGKVTQREKELSRSEALKLIGQFEMSDFWSAPADDDIYGIDGSTWVFEGCRDGRYHVVKRYMPENGSPFKSLGINLLEAAGFWRGPVY